MRLGCDSRTLLLGKEEEGANTSGFHHSFQVTKQQFYF